MPKIVWVALPLLLAAALLALAVLRGRTPSRLALNVVSSLLLLGYVATTAGLGIFWVANQQLPVFDWHYLFGYGTVLLVALHLGLNFPVVWRFLVRRPAPPAGRPPQPSRRGVLAATGLAATAAAAFVFGLRQGRSELRFDAAAQAPAGSPGPDAVERFHAFSSHSRTGVLTRAPGTDWGDPPAPFKRVVGAASRDMPAPGSADPAIRSLATLADLLWHTTGISARRGGLALRTSPSSGGLFSTELYLVVRAWPGLEAGVWHHDPAGHRLARLGDAGLPGVLPQAPVLVVATAVFGRTGFKYRDRSYRYVLADLGHALENLRVAGRALGVPMQFAAGFDESVLAAAIGVDDAQEGVLAVAGLALPPGAVPPAFRGRPAPLEPSPRGVTAAIHAATSLRMDVRDDADERAIELPRAGPAAADVLQTIAARRSVRRFAAGPLALRDLAAVLDRMAVGEPALLSAAVRIDVVVHAVAGLAPGAYRFDAARRRLQPRRTPVDLRSAARAAALDQDVIGDAGAVFVLSIDREAFAADPLGAARGYRHAFLEAGMIGERVYLEAGARGFGACAVGAFHDDEAAALVGIDARREWVVHFAALGPRA